MGTADGGWRKRERVREWRGMKEGFGKWEVMEVEVEV